jgi:NADP-dependent 3-hydroxy acid dehydrogenase YdfG
VLFFPLDLADKKSIQEFSNRTKAAVDKIDILINNAGVMMIP